MRNRRTIAMAAATLTLLAGGTITAAAAPTTPSAVSSPHSDPLYPSHGSNTIDALHYGLKLAWNAPARWLAGTATIDFRVPQNERSVRLDMQWPLRVISVTLDGRRVSVVHRHNHLYVFPGLLVRNSRHVLRVVYGGHPQPLRMPMARPDVRSLGWTTTSSGQVYTFQEPFGAATWYPVNDQPADKALYDISISTRRDWTGVSNGRLVSNNVGGGVRRTQWHLGTPAASYLTTVAIGPYHRYVDRGPHGLPLSYWVRPHDRSTLPLLRRSPTMLQWLEQRLGRYPFSTAGVVVVDGASGMETQSLVTLSSKVLRNGVAAPDLLHEYAHQWYGDLVTPRSFRDLWMNEAFATYLQIRWEATHGVTSMQHWRQYLNQTDSLWRLLYGPPGRFDKWTFASNNVYFCGALMLDRLHRKLGARMFARVLRQWPQQHRFGNGSRSAWVHFLDATTHQHLDGFVHAWLTSPTTPTV